MENNAINIIKNRDSYIKKIKEELLKEAIKTKPSLRSDFKKYPFFLGPILEGEGVEDLNKLEMDIEIDYLKTLRDDDAIKHFEIKVEKIKKEPFDGVEFLFPYEENIVAEIEFRPSTLIEYFKEEKSKKVPKFFCKKGYCFIKFGNKPKIKIAKEDTYQCRLLNILFAESGLRRSAESIFENIKYKDKFDSKNSYEKKEIISNAIKEIQRKLKDKGLGRRIKFNIKENSVWLNF